MILFKKRQNLTTVKPKEKIERKEELRQTNQNSDSFKLKEKLKRKEELRQTKAEYKLIKKEHKLTEKKDKNKLKGKEHWFNFFTKWFFVGIILVIISILISSYTQQINSNSTFFALKPIFNTVSAVLSTVGVALFIGCVFDFSKNSEAFISLVSSILSDIVVSKKFLTTLSVKDKEQALNLILQPMDAQIEQYANINDFFQKQIKESMTMFDVNFKTNVNLIIEAHKDKEKNIVYCETTLTYTIYKLNNKFEPIIVLFEKDNSFSSDVRIISPSGEIQIDKKEPTTEESAGIKYDCYTFHIPEECEKFDHLTIKRTMVEPGKDHWINYYWQSLTPYEGVTCRVQCFDELTIKEFMIFDNKAFYQVEKSDDNTRLDIISSQWLNSNTGFSFLISNS